MLRPSLTRREREFSKQSEVKVHQFPIAISPSLSVDLPRIREEQEKRIGDMLEHKDLLAVMVMQSDDEISSAVWRGFSPGRQHYFFEDNNNFDGTWKPKTE